MFFVPERPHTLSKMEEETMQANRGRAGNRKQLRRAAAIGLLAALLLGILAGVVLPTRAKSAEPNDPAGASLQQAKPTATLCFPLAFNTFRISDGYGWRKDPFTGEDVFHRGVDLACEEGTPVLAALDGTVTAARRSTTYGNYLRISHADGQETLYAHMQYLYVRAGEVVQVGRCLGTVGQTGRATGAHLHFEFLVQGVRYDPTSALGLS